MPRYCYVRAAFLEILAASGWICCAVKYGGGVGVWGPHGCYSDGKISDYLKNKNKFVSIYPMALDL